METEDNDKNLNLFSKQNITTLNVTELKLKGKIISFAFRSKDYFNKIFSFYYFRILFFKENDLIYFPIDSQFGNLCLPEYNEETKLFYCNFVFLNKYNEFSTNFAISTSNQNEYYKIYVTKFYKNGIVQNETKEIFYIHQNETDDIDYFCLTFQFQYSEIKNIISSIYEDKLNDYEYICNNYYYMHIYSSQMFYYKKNCLNIFYFKMKNNYTLIYKYIFGNTYDFETIIYLVNNSFGGFYYSDKNIRGKPFALSIYEDNFYNVQYDFWYNDIEWLFVLQLEYNQRNKGIIEIKSEEIKNQIITIDNLPLYYYLMIKNKDYININANIRIKNVDNSFLENDFEVKGYILDEDTIKRNINGEYIKLEDEIKGNYSNKFNIGLLEVNQKKKYNNSNYLLIEIRNKDILNINSSLLIEIVTKEFKKDNYFMPINQYIIESFDNNNKIEDENKYHIYVNQRGDDPIIIELSPNYNDIELIFNNETKTDSNFNYTVKFEAGSKRYIIYTINNNNIYFNIINPRKIKANYMIRYHYYYPFDNIYTSNYYLSNKIDKKYIDENDDYITLSLIFDPIKVIYQDESYYYDYDITLCISGFLYKKNESSEELINTTSMLQKRIPLYENQAINIYNQKEYNNFTLLFKSILRNENYTYDLQIKVYLLFKYYAYSYLEQFLIFTKEIDLTDINVKKEDKSLLWYILGPILGFIGFIFLFLIIFFLFKFIRLQKANSTLREDLKSFVFSNEIQKNVLFKERHNSEKDTDYDTTFI